MPRLPLALALCAVLAACAALAACDDPPQGAQSGPEVAAAAGTTPDELGGALPAAMQGRWDINAADCTTTMGDDKGLLTIDADTLAFYESRATLETVRERSQTWIDAVFAFSGEGTTWQRRMTLELVDNGQALIRRDHGADAAPDPLRYDRCPA